jgi:hypothetical protein
MATILERSRVDGWQERLRALAREMGDWRQQAPQGDDFRAVIGTQRQTVDAAADAMRKISAQIRKLEVLAASAELAQESAQLDAIINAP